MNDEPTLDSHDGPTGSHVPAAQLRWLLLATHVPASGQGGGIVRYTTEMAAALHARSDIELHVLTTSATAPFFTALVPGALIRSTPTLPRLAMALFERWGVRLTLSRNSFDVVHGTKHLLPHKLSATSILTVHDMILLDRPGDFDPVKRHFLRRPYLASLRDADILVSVSRASAQRINAWMPRAEGKVRVVPLATSSALTAVTSRPVPQLRDRRFALVVGDPSPRKNLPMIIDAWSRVSSRVPEAVLVVVGPDSWGETRYGAKFEQLQSDGKLLRLTNLGDSGLRWCYENAGVVLCPSLVEGFGLPAVEALDFGAPLVTSLDPALCEVSGDRAVHLPADRVDLWGEAIAKALLEGRRTLSPDSSPRRVVRSWAEVAAQTVAAVRTFTAAGASQKQDRREEPPTTNSPAA